MITTKDLREMCQNSVTIEDLRQNYGNGSEITKFEQTLPSLLSGELDLLSCNEPVTQDVSACQAVSAEASGDQRIDCLAMGQQPAATKELQEASFFSAALLLSAVPWYSLLTLYLLGMRQTNLTVSCLHKVNTVTQNHLLLTLALDQYTNAFDILLSLEMLSYLL